MAFEKQSGEVMRREELSCTTLSREVRAGEQLAEGQGRTPRCMGVGGSAASGRQPSRGISVPTSPSPLSEPGCTCTCPFQHLPPLPPLLPVTSHQRLPCSCHPDSGPLPRHARHTWLIQMGPVRAHPPLHPSQPETAPASCHLERSLQKPPPAQHF